MRKRWWTALVAAVVLVGLVVANRHALIHFAFERAIGAATGYQVRLGDQRLGRNHGALIDVHVSHNGEPVLDARRIDLYYSLRDLFPGSKHRFGLSAIAIDTPAFTAIHHRDGSYNIAIPSGGGATTPSAPGRVNPVPMAFTVRVRDGSVLLRDDAEFARDGSEQRITGLTADATINSAGRTHYVVTGQLHDTALEPFRAVGTVDVVRGYAMHHLQAKALPIRTIGNFIINSAALRVLAGTAHDLDAKLYAFDVTPSSDVTYHVGASLNVADAQLYVESLAKPVDDINGRLQIVDNALFARRLDATLAGVPVTVTGGLFDFRDPQLRFALAGSGDIATLRSALSFARNEPVRGATRIGVLLEGSTSAPIVVVHADAARMFYRDLPLNAVSTDLALSSEVVTIAPLVATYAGLRTTTIGTLALGKAPTSNLAIHIETTSDALPYISEVLPHEPIVADLLLHGSGEQFGARGSLASLRGIDRASALFHFDPDGIAEVAPLHIAAGNGSVDGRYRLDRPAKTSAFWVIAQGINLHAPSREIFPGATLPQLPALDGRLGYAAVVGGGSGSDVVLAGRLSAGRTTVSGVAFDGLDASFAGNLQNASISKIRASGPWGRFTGAGSFSQARLIARGTYNGTLTGLRPFLGGASASGGVAGPVALAIENHRVTVQGENLVFTNARIEDIPVERASGTIAYDNGSLQVYSADVRVAGGHVIAAGTYTNGHGLALVGSGLHGEGLRGIGLPLESGTVAVSGVLADDHGTIPAFDGGVTVANGRAQGYPVSGSANVALHGGTLALSAGVATLGVATGLVSGTIGGLASHEPAYAVRADVPAADIAGTLSTLHLPDYETTTGAFGGSFVIGGHGAAPIISGPITVGGGSVNGLPFIDASASLVADRGGVMARYGGARVGDTDLRFSAIVRRDQNAVSLRAPNATLSDFNNFFDTGDTLDGVGAIAFSLVANGGHIATDGDVDVKGFRYRALPIGDTAATWSSSRNTVSGRLNIFGTHGALHAAGTITFAPVSQLDRIVADSRYDVTATLDNMDLSTWLPAFGYPELPVLGRVDASARVRGAYPRLQLIGEAHLTDGSFGRLPIDSLTAAVGADGDAIELRDAKLEASGIVATASGRMGLTKKMPITLSVHAISDDPAHLIAQITRAHYPITGTFETTAQIGGTFAAPTFAAAFDASKVQAWGLDIASLFGSLKLNGNNIELRNAGATFATGEATLAGTLPLELSPFKVVDDKPVSFDLALSGVDPAVFDPVLGSQTHLGGTIDGHVNIAGTLLQPHVYGRMALANGSYVSELERTRITGTVASVTFDRTSATVDNFSSSFGTGRLQAKGTIAFANGFGAYGDVNYALHAVASGAQIDLPAYGKGTIDGTLDLTRTPPGIAILSGTAAASDAVIPFSAFVGQSATPGAGASIAGLPFDLGFKMTIKAGNNVRVRGGGLGAGLDIGTTGSAQLAGTLSAPTLDGTFTSTGGTLTYFDRAFRVQSGTVAFDPADGVVPVLHATGVTHVVNPDPDRSRNPYGSAEVTIKVDGSLSNLGISFDSNPPGYSKDQIIALIAPFGGFVGGIAFDPTTGNPTGPTLPGNLPGAPLANTGQALPGVFVPQSNGTITVGQEAFNILNAQFTSGILAPIENALGQGLGLDNLSLTVDYYGDVGVEVRRRLSRSLNAVYATTFGEPIRQSLGLEYTPSSSTIAQLSAFFISGPTRLFDTPGAFGSNTTRFTAGEALQGNSGFSLTVQRLFW